MEQEQTIAFDLVRMFFGKDPPLFYLEIVVRTVIIYLYALLLLRWIGSRTIAQLSTVEFLLVIALGSAVGDATFYPDVPLFHALLVITAVVLLDKGIDRLIYHFKIFKVAIDGEPLEVVRAGVINLPNLARRDLSVEELHEMLRLAGIANLGEIDFAYVEASGQLSIFKAANRRKAWPSCRCSRTRRDLGQATFGLARGCGLHLHALRHDGCPATGRCERQLQDLRCHIMDRGPGEPRGRNAGVRQAQGGCAPRIGQAPAHDIRALHLTQEPIARGRAFLRAAPRHGPHSTTMGRSRAAPASARSAARFNDQEKHMKLHRSLAIGFTLLCGASLPAMAQSSQNSCTRLQQLTDQNRERFNKEWVSQAENVIKAANQQRCQQYAEQAQGAAKQLDQQASSQNQSGTTQQTQRTQQAQQNQQNQQDGAGGQIVVTQPQPEVTVQQQAPQVEVIQPQPQVSVNQQQPQIIVRQKQPTVRVQMPQPVITIEQPQPDIIVRMPEPEVAVNTPQPQVQVSQAQPQVQVKQPQPQVRVQMEQPEVNVERNQQAEINVQQQQPVVQMQRQGQAEVNVQQAQPQVTYEAAQPKVEVEQAGEPKVQFSQTGEARVQVEQMQADGQATDRQQNAQQRASNQQQADQQATARQQAAAQQQTPAQQQANNRQAQAPSQQSSGQQQASNQEPASQQQTGNQTRANQQQAAANSADDQPTGSTTQPALAEEDRRRIGVLNTEPKQGKAARVAVSEVLNKPVVNAKGEQLGKVAGAMRNENQDFVVIDHGGALQMQGSTLVVPAQRLSLDSQGRVVIGGLTEREFQSLSRYASAEGQPLMTSQSISLSQQQ